MRHGRTARHLRVAAAAALLGLAGCANEAASPHAAKPAPFSFEIVPLGDTDMGDALRLTDLLQQEAAKQKLAPRSGGTTFRVGGVMDAGHGPNGLYVVAVLDISDAGGRRIHRIVDDNLHPKGGHLSQDDLARLAADAVSKLVDWSNASETAGMPAPDEADDAVPSAGIDDTLTTGSLATGAPFPGAAPLSFEIVMGPAPGDGAEALRSALAAALDRTPQTWARPGGRYCLQGDVAVSTLNTGDMGVTIRWQVAAPDGRPLGIVTQTRALGASRIATYWGDLAKDAAEPAARGILALLGPGPRLPGNAS